MWYLVSKNDPRVIYITPSISKVTIGRSPDLADIAFPEDSSMSRKHASLALLENGPRLVDLGSKYGTFINQTDNENAEKVKVDPNSPVTLCPKDQIKFGILTNEWVVMKENFTTCTSTVKGENLQALKANLAKLGGVLKNDWDDTCFYLTMPAITLTVKVVLALAQGSHIVTLDFWSKCCEAMMNKSPLPDANKYVPQVLESTLNKELVSFLPNTKRKKLFAGKKFLFFSKRQLQMYETVLKMTSSSGMLINESKMTKSKLASPDIIVIQYIINNATQETQNQLNYINSIVTYLQSVGKRVIADAEIGLAILYCSTEKYCNPDFNFSSEVMKQNLKPGEIKKTSNVLAPESQDPTSNSKENVVIDESLTQNISDNSVNKRKIDEIEDEVQKNASKKFASNDKSGLESNNDNDFFNFIQNDDKTEEQTRPNQQRLNFNKPVKRKQEHLGEDDDELFNFVQSKENFAANNTNGNIFDSSSSSIKRQKIEVPKSVSFPSGLSIKELLENSKIWKSSDDIIDVDNYKCENITDEIENKINNLDLGQTVVVLKKELVVKKEPVEYESDTSSRNFKKFKKVWPLKMQVTIIPKSAMSVVKPDASAVAGVNPSSQSETEDDMIAVRAPEFQKKSSVKMSNFMDDGLMFYH